MIQTPCYLLSRFTQKQLSLHWLTLTQTNSIWLKLIHSHLTWWWQSSWILAMLDSAILHSDNTSLIILTQLMMAAIKNCHLIQPFCTKRTSNSFNPDWTRWMAIYLEFCHLVFCHLGFSHFAQKTLLVHSDLTLNGSQSWTSAIFSSAILHKENLHSFILTQLDDGSHPELCHVGFRHCHLGFRHLVIFSQIPSKTLWLHSDSDSN